MSLYFMIPFIFIAVVCLAFSIFSASAFVVSCVMCFFDDDFDPIFFLKISLAFGFVGTIAAVIGKSIEHFFGVN